MLADAELDELDRFLRERSDEDSLLLDGVHGFLTALAVGPDPASPDEWLPQIVDESFTDTDEGRRMLGLLARMNASIPVELRVDAYQPILGEVDPHTVLGQDPDVPVLSAAGWCEGFSRGINLRAGLWEKRLTEDPQLVSLLTPIMVLALDEGIVDSGDSMRRLSEDEYEACLQQVPRVLESVASYWRSQAPSDSEREEAMKAMPLPMIVPRSRDGHWLN